MKNGLGIKLKIKTFQIPFHKNTQTNTMIFQRIAKSAYTSCTKSCIRSFSDTSKHSAKVAVLGAAGGIGQPLSMLLKLSDHVDELSCYDIVGTPGVAADLSHVSVMK